jgi:hypothetical protein
MAEQQTPDLAVALDPAPARRATAATVAAAIDLGWRVASLYALRPTKLQPPSPVSADMLLNRRSLAAGDRLELEVLAIEGVAGSAGAPCPAADVERLLALAAVGGASVEGEQAFRSAIAKLHLSFEKRLWAVDEPAGKAYELGNFLSDTWNRLTGREPEAREEELRTVFDPIRVARIKLLLDDLQARIDPVAVHAVSNHLDTWSHAVGDEARIASVTPEQFAARLPAVERQTVIWRQILTGDKEPEAWISHAKRAEVRDELTKQLWLRYRRQWWLLPLLAAVGFGVAELISQSGDVAPGVIGSVLALLGTVGVSRASMVGALKKGAQHWGQLMWNRALAAVICRETSVLDELYPPAG